ncbi:unnamed protein product [Prunus armeniaca]
MSFLAGAGIMSPTKSMAYSMNGHGLFCGCYTLSTSRVCGYLIWDPHRSTSSSELNAKIEYPAPDPRLASTSACVFSTRGILLDNEGRECLQELLDFIEMANLLIDNSFVTSRPECRALYCALLFEVGKPSVMACSNKVLSWVIIMTPALAPL